MNDIRRPAPGEIVASYPGKSGILVIRYPKPSDWRSAWQYINELSREQTFILMQGNHVSQAEEKRFIASQLKFILLGKAVHLFMFDGNTVIGSAGITLKRYVEKHVGVLGISIHRDYREQGLGTWFMETLLSEAKTRLPGISIVTLEVFSNNLRAQRLYHRMGFKPYGTLPRGISYRNELVDAYLLYRPI